MRKVVYFIAISVLFALDFFSKKTILMNLVYGQSHTIFPGLNFTLVFNPGIAYGIGLQDSKVFSFLLITFSILVIAAMLYYLFFTTEHKIKTQYSKRNQIKKDNLTNYSLVLIIGGALGNLFDRITYGVVIDFIDLSYNGHQWYVFNLADVFISLGAIVYILANLRS